MEADELARYKADGMGNAVTRHGMAWYTCRSSA
jgi:hypothetical protein